MTLQAAPVFELTRFENGRKNLSGLPFDYIDPDQPTLALLRMQEVLEDLAAGASSEMDLIARVQQHVKNQWDQSWHGPMQHTNALEILEDVRSGLRGNFCVYFTHVLLQALWSLGVPCRYMHVGLHHWQNHSTSECWSNEYRKWIVVDADFNLRFVKPEWEMPGLGPVREFVPQNAREVQQAMRHGRMGDILTVQGPWSAGMDYSKRLGDYFGGCFGYQADYQKVIDQGPPEWEGNGGRWFVWSEPGEPLAQYHIHHFQLTHGNGPCTAVSKIEDAYWPLNEVVVDEPQVAACRQGGVVELALETFTPFLAAFEVQVDEGPWRDLPAMRSQGHQSWGQHRWELKGMRNVVKIRTRNRAGRHGPPAVLEAAAGPCVPPRPISIWSEFAGGGMGVMAAAGDKLLVPRKGGAVVVLERGRVVGEVGLAMIVSDNMGGPPAEPLSESINIKRAAQAPAGELFMPQACAVGEDGSWGAVFFREYEGGLVAVNPYGIAQQATLPWRGLPQAILTHGHASGVSHGSIVVNAAKQSIDLKLGPDAGVVIVPAQA